MIKQVVLKAIMLYISLSMQGGHPDDTAVLFAQPSYAEWGRVAMEETAKAYQGASIVDYKYEGRQTGASGEAKEVFRLWLRQDEREFAVRVTVTVETSRDRLVNVKLEQLTSRGE
ncbi:YqzG/YhdC family protein [Paenibacillus sp. J5C_2022]|uniref:YqzG/YhdC family protein n=1 Tax=Paenibacillus sp. J5C2022 TaxID=2977129 RepID=UPI0021CF9533|nr:YqzG/YhdC family protein [Paenibacillus sp. J5C2022]MCU6707198.1 YqzG/YhdC family protein [Paenibacillus sp. J5C2022]